MLSLRTQKYSVENAIGFCRQLVLYIFVCSNIADALVVNICALSDKPASFCYAKLLPT